MIKGVENNGVKMAVISQLRFSPAVMELKEAVDSGMLGKIVMGDIYMKYHRSQEYYNQGGWRGTWSMDGGGALMNQGVHGVDLLSYIMGPVRTVFANTRTLAHNIEVEDTAAAVVEFCSGALGVIQGTTLQALINDGYSGYVVLETHYRHQHNIREDLLLLPKGSAFSYGGKEATEECLEKWFKLLDSITDTTE